MDYSEISVPFVSEDAIKKKAKTFREKWWDDSIPVKIEEIIDLGLKLEVIPRRGLKQDCDVDALIASNWKSIYVDHDCYMDDRYLNRLRFSLAHEMGHFVLHKELYESFAIDDYEDFYNLLDRNTQKRVRAD